MKTSKQSSAPQELIDKIQLGRIRLAKAQSRLKSAKDQARVAKRRRNEAKQAARRAKKQAKQAKAELAEAKQALAEAEAKLAKLGVRSPAKAPAATPRKRVTSNHSVPNSAQSASAAAPVVAAQGSETHPGSSNQELSAAAAPNQPKAS